MAEVHCLLQEAKAAHALRNKALGGKLVQHKDGTDGGHELQAHPCEELCDVVDDDLLRFFGSVRQSLQHVSPRLPDKRILCCGFRRRRFG